MDQAIALLGAAQDSASQVAIVAGNIPDPGNGSAPPGVGAAFEDIMGWAKWIALGICVLGLIFIGARMAVNSRRGEGGELLGALGMAMGGVCIIAGAVAVVGFLVTASSEPAASAVHSETAVVAAAQVQNDG